MILRIARSVSSLYPRLQRPLNRMQMLSFAASSRTSSNVPNGSATDDGTPIQSGRISCREKNPAVNQSKLQASRFGNASRQCIRHCIDLHCACIARRHILMLDASNQAHRLASVFYQTFSCKGRADASTANSHVLCRNKRPSTKMPVPQTICLRCVMQPACIGTVGFQWCSDVINMTWSKPCPCRVQNALSV